MFDKETLKYLEEVRKGKPRKFVMICKGVKILSLIVYKKGTFQNYKKQAKEEGKGLFYHGVVCGKGRQIKFQLAMSDGYKKPPTKPLILKDFVNANSDMDFKPEYELIEELPELAAEQENFEFATPPGRTATKDQGTPQGTHGDKPPDEPASGKQVEEARRQLAAIESEYLAAIRGAVTGQPAELAKKAKLLLAYVGEQAEAGAWKQFDKAMAGLETAVENLKKLKARQVQARSRLAALEPKYLAALRGAVAGPPAKLADKAKLLFAHAGRQAEAGALDQFDKALAGLETLIHKLAAAKPAGATQPDKARTRAEFEFADTRFRQIPAAMKANFAALSKGIHEAAYDKEPARLSNQLEDRYQAFCREIGKKTHAAVKEHNQKRVGELRAEVNDNPLIQHLVSNPFTAGGVFKQAITDALNEVEARLSA